MSTKYNVYETYTQHPTKKDGSWRLHFIGAPNRETLETMPLFSEVVLCQWQKQQLEDISDLVVWNGAEFLGLTAEFANDLMMSGDI
tara:strand:- start:599 stop:856 length:258 start_codon:yes stop_codon:yes gene_type:complete